jgi:hypothetical protein
MTTLDIGESEVHSPGALGSKVKAKPMATPLRKLKGAITKRVKTKRKVEPNKPVGKGSFRFRMSNPDGSRTYIHHSLAAIDNGTVAHFDEKLGRLQTYVPITKLDALAVTDNGRVWVHVARTGAWAGHPQGAFQITRPLMDSMIANFHGQQFGRVQWDFNHCSAMSPSSGNIPVVGTPAQGWIYDFKRDGDNLYALTEWKALARQYIEDDQYDSASVVINWNSVDRVTKKPIGPVIQSVALTNIAFITNLEPLAADINGAENTQRSLMSLTEVEPKDGAQNALAYSWMSKNATLRQLKSAFGLHELATAQHCSDSLKNLSGHLGAVGGDATARHDGIDLSVYVGKLRELVGDSDGMSATELIQFIDEVLDEYMAENGIEDDDSGLSTMSAQPAIETAASTQGIEPMSEPVAAVVAEPVAAVEVAAVEPVNDAVQTAASAVAEPSPELAALTLKVAELAATVSALSAENATLKAKTDVAAESALGLEVDAAILTYRDSKGLSEELRPHLLSVLKAKPDDFRAMYPYVEPDKQHLLLDLTGSRVEADAPNETPTEAPDENAAIIALGLQGLTNKLLADSDGKLSLGVAQLRADALLNTARAAIRK